MGARARTSWWSPREGFFDARVYPWLWTAIHIIFTRQSSLEDVKCFSALCLPLYSWSDDPDRIQGQSTPYHQSQGSWPQPSIRFSFHYSAFNIYWCSTPANKSATWSQGVDVKTKLSELIKLHICTEVCKALNLPEWFEIPWKPQSSNSSGFPPSQSGCPSTSKATGTSDSTSLPEAPAGSKPTTSLEPIDLELLSVVRQGQHALAAHKPPSWTHFK